MTDKRTHCTVTMTPDLYEQVKERCKQEDKPLTVWVRDLIKKELARRDEAPVRDQARGEP